MKTVNTVVIIAVIVFCSIIIQIRIATLEQMNIKLDAMITQLNTQVTPTPTIDIERLKLTQENEKLKEDVQTLQIFKNDLEGFMEAQIRR